MEHPAVVLVQEGLVLTVWQILTGSVVTEVAAVDAPPPRTATVAMAGMGAATVAAVAAVVPDHRLATAETAVSAVTAW